MKKIRALYFLITALLLLLACNLMGRTSKAAANPIQQGPSPASAPTALSQSNISPTIASPSTPTDIRGIYVYVPLDTPISSPSAQSFQAALNLPGIDGMLLVGLWNSIEPTMGQYDWSALDQWMNYAISKGKKITLVIRSGDGTPQWVFQPTPTGAGAQALNFTSTPHQGKTNKCDSETLAAPWDPEYLSSWDAMLSALAAHLKSAGTYNAVTSLRLTGINRTSDELRLPEETAQTTGLSCVSDAIATWQQAGYRPSKLLQAWDAITNSFQKNFPDKHFSVAIITNPPQVPFPPIAEDGSIINNNLPDQNQPLLQLASKKFPRRLVVQFNYLFPDQPANPFVIQAAQTLGTMAAFQSNNYYSLSGEGAACGGTTAKPTSCTSATYLQMLEAGIYPLGQNNALRAQYIELWAANANAFPEDIKQAHDEITAQPQD